MIEAFICDAVRTPIGRYAGALAAVRTDDLAALPLAALIARNPSLPAEAIDEVILGCANQAGEDNRNVARMAALLAGYPDDVPGVTVNRLCGSGLDARRRRRARHQDGRGAARGRGRRRIDVARAARHAQSRQRVQSRCAALRYDDRLAFRQSAPAGALRHRLDAGDRRERGRRVRRRAARIRTALP